LRRGALLLLLSGLSGSCATTPIERAEAPPARFYPEIEASTSGHGFVYRQAYFTEAQARDPLWEDRRRSTMDRIRMCHGPYRITRRDVRWYDPIPEGGQRCAAIVYTAWCAESGMAVPNRMEADRIGALRQDIDGPIGPECGEKDAARQPETSLEQNRIEEEQKWAALLSPSANCEGADTETADPIRVLSQTRIHVRTLVHPAISAALPRPYYAWWLSGLPQRMNDPFFHANRIVPQVRATPIADNGVNIVDLSTRVIGDAARPVYAMILEVTFPAATDPGVLQTRLAELAADLGVECSLHPSEADIL
jgi:hypothetical protein